MSVLVAEPVRSATESTRTARPIRTRPLRPGRGTGRRTGPASRPAHPVAAPRTLVERPGVTGCRVERPEAPPVARVAPPSRWRLTDRGIALVLATGLAIAAAAMVVVSLTALRVTGESYAPAGVLAAAQR